MKKAANSTTPSDDYRGLDTEALLTLLAEKDAQLAAAQNQLDATQTQLDDTKSQVKEDRKSVV